ncbi:MAG TPA: hypothetical protein VH008_31785 [Pseudonocardia sp.]|nr:hypothetical protein [Pseudonocardia sp.]
MSPADETSTATADPATDTEHDAPTPAEGPTEPVAEEEPTDTAPTPEKASSEPVSGELGQDPTRHSRVAEAAQTGRFPLKVSLPAAVGVAVVLVIALAASVTFGLMLQRKAASDRAGQEALATAKAYAVTVTSYDYQNLDRNFADVLDGATGEFKDQYSGASQTLRQLIANAKATAKGSVLGAGLSSVSPDQVEVVVFVDQAITNAATAQPRIDRNRVLMTLTPHDGRWLVAKLELM